MVWKRKLEAFFQVRERGSTLTAEVRGGLTTFLTMSYILLVNPLILKKAGLDQADVGTSTALLCGVGTLAIGLLGNAPFALGPGMGLNTFFTGMMRALTLSEALTSCFFAGMVVALLAAYHLSSAAIRHFPVPIMTAIMVGIGMYQAFIGLRQINVVVAAGNPSDIAQLGAWTEPPTLVSLAGLLLTAHLFHHNVKGSFLIGISGVTLVSWLLGIGDSQGSGEIVTLPRISQSFGLLSFTDFFRGYRRTLYCTAALVAIMLFDVAGIVYGVTSLIKGDAKSQYQELDSQAEDRSPASPPVDTVEEESAARLALLVVGIVTMVAALLGCSPVIVFLESCSGVKDGARTGLAAVVTAALFFVSTFFIPVFASVPSNATAPVLILVGSLMMCAVGSIEWYQLNVALPCFLA
eukprot:EG_transcript_11528